MKTAFGIALGDTLFDSIQCLNFAKKWFNSIFDSILIAKNSIQTVIQFKIRSDDSIQKTIQFSSQGIIDTGWIRKVPKKCQKKTKNLAFYQKLKTSIHNSFIHFTIKSNSKDYSITFFLQKIQFNFFWLSNSTKHEKIYFQIRKPRYCPPLHYCEQALALYCPLRLFSSGNFDRGAEVQQDQ